MNNFDSLSVLDYCLLFHQEEFNLFLELNKLQQNEKSAIKFSEQQEKNSINPNIALL